MVVNRLQTYNVPMLGGGLNIADAPEALNDTEARVLQNAVLIGEGRVSTRKGMVEIDEAPGEILAVFPYDTTVGPVSYGCVFVVYNAADDTIDLYRGDADGKVGVLEGVLWSGVTEAELENIDLSAATVNERLFICDKTQNLGLVVFQPHEADTIYTPLFDFDGDEGGGTAVAYPRLVAAYNNMLLMVGYGSETEASRPEMVRFSYPGLVSDTEGGGDAGDPEGLADPTLNPSAWLFARDDYFMVGTRGVPVTGMGTARGRLVLCNPYSSYILYGFDRNSFALELLDNERGCLSQRTMVEAHGIVYWWSSKGPVRWAGSQVEDIWEKIKPRLEKVDPENMFAVHVPEANQIRWYYGQVNQDTGDKKAPLQALCFDYKRNRWIDLILGRPGNYTTQLRVSAGAVVRPKVAVFSPAAAPSGLGVESITDHSAIAVWTNGDYSSDLQTEVFLAPNEPVLGVDTPGDYELLETLRSGQTRFLIDGLEPVTKYWVKVEHTRGGTRVASSAVMFTTLAEDVEEPETPVVTVDPPKMFSLHPVRIATKPNVYVPAILVTWTDSAPGLSTNIYRRNVTGGEVGFTLIREANAGTAPHQTSWTDMEDITAAYAYQYYLVHETANGNLSDPTATLGVTATAGRDIQDPGDEPGQEETGGVGGSGGGSGGDNGGTRGFEKLRENEEG